MSKPRLLPLPNGRGVSQATALETDIGNDKPRTGLGTGYLEEEYLVAGVAGTYSGSAAGPATRADGVTDYLTRILVRRPDDGRRFSGRVVVEPLNTSEGRDNDVLWAKVGSLLEANGDAWVGVSNRAVSQGVLVKYDPVRYADIDVPSNDVAWDLLAQVGELVRDPAGALFAGVAVRHAYLAGYSQSGSDVATFAMAIHSHARLPDASPVFDGYFPAAHSGSFTPLTSGTSLLPAFESVAMSAVDVPVVDLETQTDVQGFTTRLRSGRDYTAPGGTQVRRDDSDHAQDRYRLYEIPGAPHAAKRSGCEGGGSSFPTELFLRAALARLFAWTERGITPPSAPRIELATQGVVSVARLDGYGNAVGGVRSPFVDVPLAQYEAHSGPGAMCRLVGRETGIPLEVLLNRYGRLEAYLEQFSANLDATVDAGFLLPQDRSALLADVTEKARSAFAAGG
jgi:Alpha/beta hydrolase domain